jgi:prepilin-type N-terminal cleavage/methylation domain-containing protein
MKMRKKNGFTLVEMAIVLAIVALLLGTGLTLLSAQQDQRRVEDTNTALSDASEALIGYALTKTPPYMPCPDAMPGVAVSAGNVANDGLEDRNAGTGACDAPNGEGNLPWVTLGLTPSTDTWSNRLRYRVTAAFSNKTTGMLLTSTGDMNVLDAASGTPVVNTLATEIPAIIISHGRNGLGAINATGHANPAPPAANTYETENTNGTVNFVSHSPNPAGATGGEFDDQVIWLSQYILFNRMVQAGKLP